MSCLDRFLGLDRDFSNFLDVSRQNWDFSIVKTNFLKLSRFSRPLRLTLFWRRDRESWSRPRRDKSRPPGLLSFCQLNTQALFLFELSNGHLAKFARLARYSGEFVEASHIFLENGLWRVSASLASPRNTARRMSASLASLRNTAWQMLASLASLRNTARQMLAQARMIR